jgi:hypothetical protein
MIEIIDRKAMTEESSLAEINRDAGAMTETPARGKPGEVPSRASQGKTQQSGQ